MGAFLDKPMTDKTTEYGEGNCLKYGLSAMQGWRKDMEDAHICSTKLESEWKDWSVFGVFDGHAGASVSSYLSEYLVQTIQECTTLVGEGEVLIKNVKEGIKKSFMKIDSKLKKEPGFINGSERAGSTAIVVLVSPTVIVWANCGDSRGFLCRNRKVFWTTEDHKPLNAKEKLRIERAGGTVINQRVNGTLAVSRAIGDFEYKQNGAFKDEEQLVSAEPDVSHIMRHPDDEFIFLACDGVYDVMSNDEIAAFIQLRLSMTDKLPDICSSLIDTCLHKNSRDNMSAILVTLPGAPSPSEESIAEFTKHEEAAKVEIEKKLQEYVQAAEQHIDLDEHSIMLKLTDAFQDKNEIYSKKPDICRRLEELKKEKFGESYDDFSDQDQVDDITEGPTKPIQVKIFTAEGITQINNASEEGDCTSGLVTNDVPTESP